jgi:hypothetical protein
VSVFGGKRALEANSSGEPHGLAERGIVAVRNLEGFEEWTVRHLNDGSAIFLIQILLVEDSRILPFKSLILAVELGSQLPILVPTGAVMPLNLAISRGLGHQPLTDDEMKNFTLRALPLLGDQVKTDVNCFMVPNTPTAWMGQTRFCLSPAYSPGGGRPTVASKKNKRVPLRKYCENTKLIKAETTCAKSESSHTPHGTKKTCSLPPQEGTPSMGDFMTIIQSQQAALMKSMDRSEHALLESSFLKGKIEVMEAARLRQEEHWKQLEEYSAKANLMQGRNEGLERLCKEAEKAVMSATQQADARCDKTMAQASQVMNYSLLQSGHSTLPEALPSTRRKRKRDRFHSLLERCELEDRLDELWEFGVRSADAVKCLTESDRLALKIKDFDFARLLRAAEKN